MDDDWYGPETATFGDRIAASREAAGLGQDEFARRLGVQLKTLKGWENDLSEPRANKLQMVAGLLNVSMIWLLTGEGEGVAPPGEASEDLAVRDLLIELRSVREDLRASQQRLARLEKKLRASLVAGEAT